MRRAALALLLVGCPTTETPQDDDDAPVVLPTFPLCINEFMPANGRGPIDETGEYADWIELHNPSDEAFSADGVRISDDPDDPDATVLDGLTIEPGGFLLLWADGDVDEGDSHLGFGMSRDGGTLALLDAHDQGSVIHYGTVADDVALARTEDCCPADCLEPVAEGTPGRSNALLGEADLVRRGGFWSWTTVEPIGDWAAPDFDETGWEGGTGPLGYGDGHVVSFTTTPATLTTWFRGNFRLLQDDLFASLRLELLRDAGAAVYLNGVEVVRSNLPDGPLEANTRASSDVDGQEEAMYFPFEVDASLLVSGRNQIAVELHDPAPASADRSFDLALVGRRR